ncbi:hypothetical protein [Bacteriovorax sp. Seq25_V]|uniref:hypothetical protein n=1 Tax=Bacteriovorax sp. Seq25_V TaxID=1201288 RepID=UPI00038A23A5|nr:hypothetical protein [Bacteriovorax sp. Seq25_V]EQC44230.1 hypothetical protein M900_A0402 [Bacteriovorax sp. Seq25_V]
MRSNPTNGIIIFSTLLFVLIGVLGLVIWTGDNFTIKEMSSLAATNRSINSYFGAIITVMALIVTLTSNLYSPHLARLFVSHPLAIGSICFMLITNYFITISHLISSDHRWFQLISFISFTLTIVATFSIIPVLYLISKFIRPSFFIPLTGQYALKELNKLSIEKYTDKYVKRTKNFFSYIDVISNMASTAIQRKDKSVIRLVINEQFNLLRELIEEKSKINERSWRNKNFHFSNGLSEEGKYHLKKEKMWPEAYIISKVLEQTKTLGKNESDLLPLICREMTTTNDMCINLHEKKISRLIISTLNSMLKDALESKSPTKFNYISYYYRMNIELLIEEEDLCRQAIHSFLHYGLLARESGNHRFAKSFLYDLGRIIHYLSFDDEKMSLELYESDIKETWKAFLNSNERIRLHTLKSIVKTFWILYSQNYYYLTAKIKNDFLSNNLEHAIILKNLLRNDDPLDKEFNDTLVSVETLSGMPKSLAKDFLSDFPVDLPSQLQELG